MDAPDDGLPIDSVSEQVSADSASPSSTPPTYPSIWQSVGIVCIVIVFLIGCAPLMLLAPKVGNEVSMLLYYLAAMGLSFAAVHSIRRRKLGSSTYNLRMDSWKLVIPLMLGSVALLLRVVGPIASLIPMPDEIGEALRGAGEQTGAATFAFLVLAAPIIEELIFRGIMLDGLLKRYRPLTAILVSSVAFGLVHLNPWQFVTGVVLGIFMGWVYYRSRSVGACILIHMAANFTAFVMRLVFDFNSFTPTQDFFATYGGRNQFVVITGMFLGVIALSVLFLRREFDKIDLLRNRELAMASDVNVEM
ncbi:MAG: type II CAAX endopeptidase family protein [Bythopirellula sp.]|nr:type II CAAX endopeptidase family protein [Bythopirellula sp.]